MPPTRISVSVTPGSLTVTDPSPAVVVVFAALDDGLELPHAAAITPRTTRTAITRKRI